MKSYLAPFAQVERVCPELDLESLCSVDITAAVAAVAATGREEAEVRVLYLTSWVRVGYG